MRDQDGQPRSDEPKVGRHMTYATRNRTAKQFARALRGSPLTRNSAVGVSFEHSPPVARILGPKAWFTTGPEGLLVSQHS